MTSRRKIHPLIMFFPISSVVVLARLVTRQRDDCERQHSNKKKKTSKTYRTPLRPGKPARNLKWFWSLLWSPAHTHTFRLNDPRNQFVCPSCPSPYKILNTHASMAHPRIRAPCGTPVCAVLCVRMAKNQLQITPDIVIYYSSEHEKISSNAPEK